MEQTMLEIYATEEALLRSQISNALNSSSEVELNGTPIGLLVPDSNALTGSITSGAAYDSIAGQEFETVVVVSSTKNDPFNRITICKHDICDAPLGPVRVNSAMREELCDEDDDIFIDDTGHFGSTGLAVQLPFLQSLLPEFTVLPIVMGNESIEFCKELGNAIGEVIFNRRVLVVATVNILRATDSMMQELRRVIESFDIDALVALFARNDELELEGSGPLLVMLMATRHRRTQEVRVVHFTPPANERLGSIAAIALQV